MKRMILVLSVAVTLLSACMVPPTNSLPTPVESVATVAPLVTENKPSPKLPGASFEARTYVNDTAGFALDYPAGWTVTETVVGERGSQVQFLSSADLADAATLPAGATRVSARLYQWDPKNDLTAFVAQQKSAWDASGVQILEEQPLTLDLGLPATRLMLQTPETTTLTLITAVGDQYLVLSGEGDLELVKEIVQRVRPISR